VLLKQKNSYDKYPLLVTSIGVVDEVLHFIIRREAVNKYGIKRAYDLRRLIRSKGISFAKGSLDKFTSYLLPSIWDNAL